jgi:hypothetical protein
VAKRKSIVRQGRHAETSCAACGRRLELWDATTGLDGATVCASGCLGQGILTMRQHNAEAADEPPQLPESAYADEADYGGAVDGLGNVSSDADPGL